MATGRKNVKYNVGNVFVGPSPSDAIHLSSDSTPVNYLKQLTRIQSIGDSINNEKTPVNQFNQMAAIGYISQTPPTVQVTFSYLLTNGWNEKCLGFDITGTKSFLANILDGTQDEKNYFYAEAPTGQDAAGLVPTTAFDITAYGNCSLSSYSLDLSVGNSPTVTFSVDGNNVEWIANAKGGELPIVDPATGCQNGDGKDFEIPTGKVSSESSEPLVLRAGDVKMSIVTPFGGKVPGVDGEIATAGIARVQSAQLQIGLTRNADQALGIKYPTRDLQFPIEVTLNVTTEMADIKAGSINDLYCQDEKYDLGIEIKTMSCDCTGATIPNAVKIDLKGFRLTSFTSGLQIGSNKTMELSYTGQIGSANDLVNGVFFTGSSTAPFPLPTAP